MQGCSLAIGTYQEIIDTGIDYAKLLKQDEDDEDTKSEVSNTNESIQNQISLPRSTSREVSDFLILFLNELWTEYKSSDISLLFFFLFLLKDMI